jgi:hypothetical protein
MASGTTTASISPTSTKPSPTSTPTFSYEFSVIEQEAT